MTSPEKRQREIWVLPHQYSCGGYWVAERFPDDKEFTYQGAQHKDNLSFWLLSGRMEVLTKVHVETRLMACRSRGEEVKVVWANSLPEGARILNLR
jgi:hypothetical protein